MRRRGFLGVMVLAVATTLMGTGPASAAPVRFGSKLSVDDSPPSGLNLGCPEHPTSACTWILVEAYQRPDGGQKAPKNGTIKKIRIIAGYKSGSFRPVIARAKGAQELARVIRKGPLLNYHAQPDDPEDEDGIYEIQTFSVNLAVSKGDSLGIESIGKTSLINCSGQDVLVFQPTLPTGGPFRTADDGAPSCTLLIEAQYG